MNTETTQLREGLNERLYQYVKETLSEKAKEMQMINFRLEKILRKSWERPSFFTMEDWYAATELVKQLNSLCA